MTNKIDLSTLTHVCGIDISKVRLEHLVVAIQKVGLPVDTGLPTWKLVKQFSEWSARYAKEIAVCDICGGESPSDMELCPYCGDAGTGEVIEAEVMTSRSVSSDLVPAPTPVGTDLVVFDESALDEANRETDRLKAAIVAGHWKLGRHLHEIHQSGLWKARLGADGQPKYKTFSQYCVNEVKMSDANVYRIIDISLSWDEQTVARLGTEKLDLIMRSPAQAKEKLLAAANAGATTKDLKAARAEAIKEFPAADGEKQRWRAPSETPKPKSSPKPTTPKRDMVTLVEIEGERTFPMFARKAYAKGKKVPATDPLDAVGFHFPVNEVSMMITIERDASGNLVGKLTIKRQ